MTSTMNSARLEQLQKLHAADPGDADVCYMIAQEFGKGSEHASAIEWYDKCLESDAAYCYAYFFKAMALTELNRKPEAIGVLNAGVAKANEVGNAKAISELTALLEQTAG